MKKMANNFRERFLFWLAFVALVVALCWTGYHHFFGVGYFRPVLVAATRILDLGDVLPDAVVEGEFSVTNGGWRALQIMSVRTGCASCVKIVSYPKEPIRRGETVPIRLAFDSKSFTGKVRRSILILSNDPVRPIYSILIDAVVLREEESSEGE